MRASSIVPHRTTAELEALYRAAERPVERSRWHILWQKSKKKTVQELIGITGYSRATISALIRKYNEHGVEAVVDRRRYNKSEPALRAEQQERLFQVLQSPPPGGGLWSSGKVQQYVRAQFSVDITEPCAWGYLRRLGFTVQVPRPTHVQAATPAQQEAFKKK